MTRNPEPRLVFDRVAIWRGGALAVRDASLTVRKGEHWALMGPNGSGKSSLALSACGYLHLSKGRIFSLEGWRGDIHMPELRERIGVVGQPLSELFLDGAGARLSGLETVLSGKFGSLGLFDGEIPIKFKKRARNILSDMGALDLEKKPFRDMSTGERQACLIGRSRMADNALLLLDEPCAGLDPGARSRFLARLNATLGDADAPTLLMTTHHVEEIVENVTHVALMKDGRIVGRGKKERMLTGARLSNLFGIKASAAPNNGRYILVEE